MSIGKVRLLFSLASLFSNPYRACRKFLQKRGEKEIYGYGETPFAALETIAEKCRLSPVDHWLDLGAGRGAGCFWMALSTGCRATGVEWVPSFVRLARLIAFLSGSDRVSFECKEMVEADFSQATAVYLYGTCLPDEKVARLAEKMKQLPPGARVVSVSEPLNAPHLPLVESFPLTYPWGETEGYLHIKK